MKETNNLPLYGLTVVVARCSFRIGNCLPEPADIETAAIITMLFFSGLVGDFHQRPCGRIQMISTASYRSLMCAISPRYGALFINKHTLEKTQKEKSVLLALISTVEFIINF